MDWSNPANLVPLSSATVAEWACFLQRDAAYLYEAAAAYRDKPGSWYQGLAVTVQQNAAHSAKCARVALGLLE